MRAAFVQHSVLRVIRIVECRCNGTYGEPSKISRDIAIGPFSKVNLITDIGSTMNRVLIFNPWGIWATATAPVYFWLHNIRLGCLPIARLQWHWHIFCKHPAHEKCEGDYNKIFGFSLTRPTISYFSLFSGVDHIAIHGLTFNRLKNINTA